MSAAGTLPNTHEEIGRRAAQFYEKRRFGSWTDTDRAEFEAWLAESPLHRVGYLRVEWSVARTEQLATHRPPGRTRLSSEGKPIFMRPRFIVPLLTAASIALSVAIGIPLAGYLSPSPDRTYSTEVGGRTLLKFADGTQIDLDTDTLVRFRMTAEERTVWLEKGQAWFHVSHNPANPFSVVIGKHRVTDVGTEFLIRRGAGEMEVALLNGRAALSTDGAPVAMLIPGDDAVAKSMSVSVTRKTARELADALAWRRGVLVFRSTRLADAVREFNRYNRTKLVIADPSIADLKFSAEIKNDNFEGFLLVAESMLKLRADWHGDDILLSRAKRSGAAAP